MHEADNFIYIVIRIVDSLLFKRDGCIVTAGSIAQDVSTTGNFCSDAPLSLSSGIGTLKCVYTNDGLVHEAGTIREKQTTLP